jgi:hypothetical protein
LLWILAVIGIISCVPKAKVFAIATVIAILLIIRLTLTMTIASAQIIEAPSPQIIPWVVAWIVPI